MKEKIGKTVLRNYLNTVYEMDKGIGQLFDRLVQRELWENTFFVFASDNGAAMEGGSNFPLRGAKGEIFEGGNKVPSFIAAPMLEKIGLQKNSTIDKISHFVDIPARVAIFSRL